MSTETAWFTCNVKLHSSGPFPPSVFVFRSTIGCVLLAVFISVAAVKRRNTIFNFNSNIDWWYLVLVHSLHCSVCFSHHKGVRWSRYSGALWFLCLCEIKLWMHKITFKKRKCSFYSLIGSNSSWGRREVCLTLTWCSQRCERRCRCTGCHSEQRCCWSWILELAAWGLLSPVVTTQQTLRRIQWRLFHICCC